MTVFGDQDYNYELTMDRDLYDEWLRRLDSGKIQQGHNVLEDLDHKQCCVGVLCNILVERGELEKRASEDFASYIFVDPVTGEESVGVLPSSRITKLVFGDGNNSLGAYSAEDALTSDNDALGKSFAEISQIVRENVVVRESTNA